MCEWVVGGSVCVCGWGAECGGVCVCEWVRGAEVCVCVSGRGRGEESVWWGGVCVSGWLGGWGEGGGRRAGEASVYVVEGRREESVWGRVRVCVSGWGFSDRMCGGKGVCLAIQNHPKIKEPDEDNDEDDDDHDDDVGKGSGEVGEAQAKKCVVCRASRLFPHAVPLHT